ncbi:nicotinate-nucleotide adenylyltransferase [Kiloniella laminariae]|uniref:Probable nicotinate-nucleotide adenylyltransferase n=1 Tax=Kiloniella laminariae TaxID=454162 RepID=A0ABT4LMK3_9PROT|nr:nicotinate-nucleotide adenylyltransferase [Kiloniella laminariae]MCZ4282318.1 nicotinate-nucleotide adenylyltransferase [Kiloniella laminariae]
MLRFPPSLQFDKLTCRRSLARALGGRLPHKGSTVGLLGGSFNPAHSAHDLITRQALTRLDLDEVWWMVSPQNPLKSPAEMAPLAARVDSALVLQQHPRIRITTIESQLGSVYTADTLRKLAKIFPGVRFVWLMGADNLLQISHWRDWKDIFQLVSIAVFARPGYSLPAASAKAAQYFAHTQLPERKFRQLSKVPTPVWTLIHGRQSRLSSTQIRQKAKVSGKTC